jgi:hypothetical protein
MKQANVQIAAPGFYGLNTEASPSLLRPEYAAIADNMVIDSSGRVASRKGYRLTGDITPVGAIKNLHEARYTDGTVDYFAVDDTNIYRVNSTGDIQTTQAHGATADFQIVTLNDDTVFFQQGEDPWMWDNSAVAFVRQSTHTDSAGTAPTGDVGAAAYGRVWTAVGGVLHWSDLLIPAAWTGGTAGSLDLTRLWPVGNDSITAIVAHNQKLIVFGRQSILVFGSSASDGRLADPAADLLLEDTIVDIGCIGKYATTVVGSDVWFVDASGLRSLGRTIQEKSLPIGEISRNISSQFKSNVKTEGKNTRLMYDPDEAFVICLLPGQPLVYVFDTRQMLENGSARVTTWSNMDFECVLHITEGRLWFGNPTAICWYTGYTDAASSLGVGGNKYRIAYYTYPQDFGSPANLKIPKEVNFIIAGGLGQMAVCYWNTGCDFIFNRQTFKLNSVTPDFYGGPDDYGITVEDDPLDPTEYGSGGTIGCYEVPLADSGVTLAIGVEVDVVGQKVAIQEINIQTKIGRMV